MSAQTFNLAFNGYWREPNIGGIPAASGVYCVYVCTFNEIEKTVTLGSLIYIGEAGDVRGRVANHECFPAWRRHLQQTEQLCFSFAPVDATVRNRVEAALIFKHKPPENSTFATNFPFEQTTVISSGRADLLAVNFTVMTTS